MSDYTEHHPDKRFFEELREVEERWRREGVDLSIPEFIMIETRRALEEIRIEQALIEPPIGKWQEEGF